MQHRLEMYLREQFKRPGNGLVQVVLLNALCFLGFMALKVLLVIAGYAKSYEWLHHMLVLPSAWSECVRQPWSLLTHFWVHHSFLDALWGLLWLHTMGRIVLERLGSRHFLIIYVLGGVAGGILFLVLYHFSPHLSGAKTYLSGFAGSLYAVMVAAAALSPQMSFHLLFIGAVKLKYVVIFVVLLSFAHLASAEPAASIAHLGGAIWGYLYVSQWSFYAWLRRRGWTQYQPTWKVWKGRKKASSKGGRKPKDQKHLDRILDKVAATGYEGLTPEEKRQLFDAGQ